MCCSCMCLIGGVLSLSYISVSMCQKFKAKEMSFASILKGHLPFPDSHNGLESAHPSLGESFEKAAGLIRSVALWPRIGLKEEHTVGHIEGNGTADEVRR